MVYCQSCELDQEGANISFDQHSSLCQVIASNTVRTTVTTVSMVTTMSMVGVL
jgi:hypothetical protein